MSGGYHWVCMYLLCATQIQKQHHSFILPTEPEKSRFTATEKSRMPVKWWKLYWDFRDNKTEEICSIQTTQSNSPNWYHRKRLGICIIWIEKIRRLFAKGPWQQKKVNPCCEGVGGGMNIFWYHTIWWYFYSSLVLMWLHALFQLPCRDYCQKLALALTSNPKTTLNSLSLNGNSIEDRGID